MVEGIPTIYPAFAQCLPLFFAAEKKEKKEKQSAELFQEFRYLIKLLSCRVRTLATVGENSSTGIHVCSRRGRAAWKLDRDFLGHYQFLIAQRQY